tara:strand:+ start:32 stop:172 length:141 start_codon:yes stop_codon:yes gene_type:complete
LFDKEGIMGMNEIMTEDPPQVKKKKEKSDDDEKKKVEIHIICCTIM